MGTCGRFCPCAKLGPPPAPLQWQYAPQSIWTPMPPPLCFPRCWRPCGPYWIEHFGNASSIHQHGQQARTAVERARETMAALLQLPDAEVVFNSGGTEGDNTAIFGLLHPGDHLITTSIEHSAVLHSAHKAQERGIDVTFLSRLLRWRR